MNAVMTPYYGTKRINATPMNRADYNKLRGWTLPADENGADEGYLVEYLDGGKPNLEGYPGYVSWSPKEQFDKAYQPLNAMSFGHALKALKEGSRVCRAGWNGKGMWLGLVGASNYIINTPPYSDIDDGPDGAGLLPWIGMYTADQKFVPWFASQSDMLSDDWMVVN